MEVADKKRNKIADSRNGRMTERQIKRKVGEAWTLLKDPVFEKGLLVSAELLYYDKDKTKVREQLRKREHGGHYAFFYYGKIDPNVIYVL